MKKIFFFIAVILMIPHSQAKALITGSVSTNAAGQTSYTFSDGTTGYSYADSAGIRHYQFSNGLYGSVSTNAAGYTNYVFDEVGKKLFINGRCVFPNSGSCTEESQYQDMYNQAAQGLPTCNQNTAPGSFTTPAESCTPEGRERLIMSGTYGPWLKTCRQSIDYYVKALPAYEQCERDQNEEYQKMAEAKLNYLKQMLDAQITKTEAIKPEPVKTCPAKSHMVYTGACVCEVGLVLDEKTNTCMTCEERNPNSFTEVYGKLTACSTCIESEGYYLDRVAKKCVLKTVSLKQVSATSTVKTKPKVKEVVQNKEIINSKLDNISSTIFDLNKPATTSESILKDTLENSSGTAKNVVDENKSESVKKIGTFQKIGEKVDGASSKVSSFFKMIVIKIKFW
jgi:hypothetical protein